MNAKLIALAFALLCSAGLAAPAGAPYEQFCNAANEIDTVKAVMAIGMLVLSMAIALAYMVSQIIHEPRLSEWAKAQAPQLLSSCLIFLLVAFLISLGCGVQIGEFTNWMGNSRIDPALTAYGASFKYLEWGADKTETGITFIRAKMGALNIRATTTTFNSAFPMGALGGSGYPNSGDYATAGVHATLLQLNTSFLLSIMFQYFCLLLFTSKAGIFLLLLPIGLTLRSVPFMRGFGGALAGLAVALYLCYPLLLALSYLMLDGIAPAYDVDTVISGAGITDLAGAVKYENSFAGHKFLHDDPEIKYVNNTAASFKFTAFNFLRAVLLPLFGMAVTVGFARDLSKLFGDEIDANKLVQMV